jgi:hypothetical protein
MRHFKEIRDEKEKKIQFFLYDEKIKEPARCNIDMMVFDRVSEEERNHAREVTRRSMERELDRRLRHPKLEDKIMTEEEWRALVPHESEAEICPVPTWKEIVEWAYESAIRERS